MALVQTQNDNYKKKGQSAPKRQAVPAVRVTSERGVELCMPWLWSVNLCHLTERDFRTFHMDFHNSVLQNV
eukprot:8669602-Pyramimonas_sp.AAC.1